MTNHETVCEAPICQDSSSTDLVWYPGEEVCKKTPFTWFQKKQTNMNNLLNIGKLRHPNVSIKCVDLV